MAIMAIMPIVAIMAIMPIVTIVTVRSRTSGFVRASLGARGVGLGGVVSS